MKVTRRELLRTAFTTLSIIALSKIMNDPILSLAAEEAKKILAKQTEPIHVIWIQSQACSGCSISLLNAVEPSIVDVLSDQLKEVGEVVLDFHPTIMTQWGVEHLSGTEDSSVNQWDAVEILEKAKNGEISPFVLVTEGAFPDETIAEQTGGYWCSLGIHNGEEIKATDYLRAVSQHVAAVVAVGACIAFGGIPQDNPNPTHTTGTIGLFSLGAAIAY
ncbi:MAG: hypothetical protein ACP6IS_07220 [Candidatus Asgardarchaeia archaeon]